MMTGMGLFRSDEEKATERAAAAEQLARIEAMALEDLAAELLVKGWGRGGPADAYEKEQGDMGLEVEDLTGLVAGDVVAGTAEGVAIYEAVEEALQLLEHARLVVFRVTGSDYVHAYYRPTRAGLAAIDAGDVRARLG
jgi:hypothetical protein